jgi:hypothetical protein
LKSKYYEALKILINRGELSLGSIGFGDEYSEFLQDSTTYIKLTDKGILKLFKDKIEVAL